MFKNSIIIAIVAIVIGLFAGNSFAQSRPVPGEMGGLLGVGKSTTSNTSAPAAKQPAAQNLSAPSRISSQPMARAQLLRSYIANCDRQIAQWIQLRDTRYAPYLNDRNWYQWARYQYNQANVAISYLQRQRQSYVMSLNRLGQY